MTMPKIVENTSSVMKIEQHFSSHTLGQFSLPHSTKNNMLYTQDGIILNRKNKSRFHNIKYCSHMTRRPYIGQVGIENG